MVFNVSLSYLHCIVGDFYVLTDTLVENLILLFCFLHLCYSIGSKLAYDITLTVWLKVLLRLENPSSMCAKLHTGSKRNHAP